MSLVEKALKKMQESAKPATAPAVASNVAPRVPAEPPRRTGERTGETGAHRAVVAPPQRVVAFNAQSLRAGGLLPPEHQERQLAQQYRQIKRPLIDAAIGRNMPALPNGRLIMLASALSGEGKTFTSLNLAMSMAREKDVSIVLVDADVAKPHISRALGVNHEPGLLDLLRDPTLNPESVLMQTDLPNLSLLPVGSHSENATELLASERMEQVAQALVAHDEQRLVLFDSSPLMLTTEAQALAQVVGQIALVVRASRTSHQVLLEALESVRNRAAVSLILNQCKASSNNSYYYYGYGDNGAQTGAD